VFEIRPVVGLRTCISIRMQSPCKETGVFTLLFGNEENDDDEGNTATDSVPVP